MEMDYFLAFVFLVIGYILFIYKHVIYVCQQKINLTGYRLQIFNMKIGFSFNVEANKISNK